MATAAAATASAEGEGEAKVEKNIPTAWPSSTLHPPSQSRNGDEQPLFDDSISGDTEGCSSPASGRKMLPGALKIGADITVYDWGRSSPDVTLSPALRGVQRVAVETRRSFEAIDRGEEAAGRRTAAGSCVWPDLN